MGLGRKGWVAVALVAGLIALSAGVSGRFLGRKRLRFPYLTGSLSAAEYQGLASEAGWRARQIGVGQGIHLNGLVRPPQTAGAPWVLFYNGNDSRMLRVGQAFLRQLAADQDWGLAVYAYRGYDSSEGVPHLADLAADAAEILTQLCATEKVAQNRVHVVGFSIGGHLAVRTLAATGNPKPASLTLLAAADDIVMVRRSLYAKLDPGDDLQTRPFLDAVPAPVLVIQGTADEALGGPQQGRDIAAKLGDRAKYLELPGVGHTALLSNETALRAVREFIAAHDK